MGQVHQPPPEHQRVLQMLLRRVILDSIDCSHVEQRLEAAERHAAVGSPRVCWVVSYRGQQVVASAVTWSPQPAVLGACPFHTISWQCTMPFMNCYFVSAAMSIRFLNKDNTVFETAGFMSYVWSFKLEGIFECGCAEFFLASYFLKLTPFKQIYLKDFWSEPYVQPRRPPKGRLRWEWGCDLAFVPRSPSSAQWLLRWGSRAGRGGAGERMSASKRILWCDFCPTIGQRS